MAPSAVDSRQPMPLYHQIVLVLRGKIEDGSYPQGGFLPGEPELARRYGVSRITAKRALDELAAAGLVVRQRGRGTQVRAAAAVPVVRSSVEGLLENLLAMGLKTTVTLLDFAYVPAPPEVAAAMECRAGETVQRAVRVRRVRGEAFSHLTTHVPETVGRTFDARDLAETPLLALLERAGVGVADATQTISATLADWRVAHALDVPVGAPLLRITRVVRDQAGRPVEHIVGLYRPDRYQLRMDLARTRGPAGAAWTPAPDAAAPEL